MKIVINSCYGGFGFSDAAYERLGQLGVPIRKYVEERRGDNGLYERHEENEGMVIFDSHLDGSESEIDSAMRRLIGSRYWSTWEREQRANPLVVQTVEELGNAASDRFAKLKVVEIPDGIEWEIDEYDGIESIHEKHRSWS